jgi:hypothetical protein
VPPVVRAAAVKAGISGPPPSHPSAGSIPTGHERVEEWPDPAGGSVGPEEPRLGGLPEAGARASLLRCHFPCMFTPPCPYLSRKAETAAAGGGEVGEKVWPGFRLQEIPIAIYDESGEVRLAHHPDPPETFRRIEVEACRRRSSRAPASMP